MSKSSTQTSEQRLDPAAERFRNYIFNQTQKQGQFGPSQEQRAGYERLSQIDPQVLQALQGLIPNLGFAGSTFQQGMQGISGQDIANFQNPYQEQVVGATIEDFNRLRETGLNAIGSEATRAGAFGGTRMGVAEGTAVGELGRAEAGVLGNIRSQGFQSALQAAFQNRGQMMGAAQGAANLGFGGMQGIEQLIQRSAGGQIGLGQLPWQNLQTMGGIMGGMPAGMTTTNTTQGSPLQAILGAAATGAGFLLGGPAGAATSSQIASAFRAGGGTQPGQMMPIERSGGGLDLSALFAAMSGRQ